MAMVMGRWEKNPRMHIYHYAPYKTTAMRPLVGRPGICIEEVDRLLRQVSSLTSAGQLARVCGLRWKATR